MTRRAFFSTFFKSLAVLTLLPPAVWAGKPRVVTTWFRHPKKVVFMVNGTDPIQYLPIPQDKLETWLQVSGKFRQDVQRDFESVVEEPHP